MAGERLGNLRAARGGTAAAPTPPFLSFQGHRTGGGTGPASLRSPAPIALAVRPSVPLTSAAGPGCRAGAGGLGLTARRREGLPPPSFLPFAAPGAGSTPARRGSLPTPPPPR